MTGTVEPADGNTRSMRTTCLVLLGRTLPFSGSGRSNGLTRTCSVLRSCCLVRIIAATFLRASLICSKTTLTFVRFRASCFSIAGLAVSTFITI